MDEGDGEGVAGKPTDGADSWGFEEADMSMVKTSSSVSLIRSTSISCPEDVIVDVVAADIVMALFHFKLFRGGLLTLCKDAKLFQC